MRTIETKGQFARRKNRGPSAVSNWLSQGKISPEALVGHGNAARIWVERAEADLSASLDPSQQFANTYPANVRTALLPLSPAPPADSALLMTKPATPGAASDREIDLARRARAAADRAELEAEFVRRKLAADEGRYVIAEDAARAWRFELAKLRNEIETFMSTALPLNLAERFGLDLEVLTIEICEKFGRFRGDIGEAAQQVSGSQSEWGAL